MQSSSAPEARPPVQGRSSRWAAITTTSFGFVVPVICAMTFRCGGTTPVPG